MTHNPPLAREPQEGDTVRWFSSGHDGHFQGTVRDVGPSTLGVEVDGKQWRVRKGRVTIVGPQDPEQPEQPEPSADDRALDAAREELEAMIHEWRKFGYGQFGAPKRLREQAVREPLEALAAARNDQPDAHALKLQIQQLEFDLRQAQEKLSPNEIAKASTAPECCGSWAAATERERDAARERISQLVFSADSYRHQVDGLQAEVAALRGAGDELQSAYSRLAEWVRGQKPNMQYRQVATGSDPDRWEWVEDGGPPYEVLMDAVGAQRLVDAWTEARRG